MNNINVNAAFVPAIPAAVISQTMPQTANIPAPAAIAQTSPSDFRHVFQTSDKMKSEFVKFLKTIFYQLDDKKVLALMEELLADPLKSDEDIYKELLARIHSTKKTAPILSKLWSLSVLKHGMGKQAVQLLKGFQPKKFHDYMEIYDRRYVKTLRKIAKLPLDGKVVAVCNQPEVGMVDKIQAGALFSSYPYQQHVPLNDSDCTDPFMQPEKTHAPIGEEVEDNSIDLIGCLGGLHHIPADRVDAFVQSLHRKLRPGSVILMRDHNVKDQAETGQSKEDIRAIAAVVHTFVNAADGVSWEVEKKEIREFKSAEEWTALMHKHGFTRISNQALVLPDDPTENAMMAFIKTPTSLEELQQALSYRNDYTRPKDGTRATWIEWGNVRFAKQYAAYIQNHHTYAFDYIGHMRQHWKHFYHYIKESAKDPEVSLKELILSDNFAMNAFILFTASLHCGISAATAFPSALLARWKHGKQWRDVCHLSALEKFEAENEKAYSEFIDHTPFYMYPYMDKMKQMWAAVLNPSDTIKTRIINSLSAIPSSIGFMAKALASFPVRSIYTAEANQEPDTIKILISDPHHELNGVIARWEKEKNAQTEQKCKIEVIHSTPDGYKLVSVPRYRPFTKICGYLSETSSLQLLEIGGQKEISVDLLMDKLQTIPAIDGAQFVYALDKLQDEQQRKYLTYQVQVAALKHFQRAVSLEKIEYIHE